MGSIDIGQCLHNLNRFLGRWTLATFRVISAVISSPEAATFGKTIAAVPKTMITAGFQCIQDLEMPKCIGCGKSADGMLANDSPDEPMKTKSDAFCAICGGTYQEIKGAKREMVKLQQCGHMFCKICTDEVLAEHQHSCPTCQLFFNSSHLIKVLY